MGLTIRKLLRLFDVNADGIADGETLVWDAAAGEFIPGAGGGGGAPTDATYLVTAANAGLSAEVAVGATPGGELGGTWASPTVDASHSGSTHAAVQAAAEATAAAALASHAGAADPHTGYRLESVAIVSADIQDGTIQTGDLAFDPATQAELDAHLNDTADAHDASAISILDTAADFTATDVEGALAELQADAEADATALSDHIADTAGAHAGTAISNTPAGAIAATTVQAAIDELDSEKAAVSHAHAGEDITSGTVADARIAATIARDSEVTAAVSASEAGQVRDGDAAGGVLAGTYPSPSFASDMATQAELDAHVNDISAAHAASAVSADSTTLVGTGTDVQAVLEELDNAIVATETVANAAVPKALYDANTVLAADSDNTPAALTMGASTILARLAAGNIKAATPAELRTLLDVPTNAEAILDALIAAKGDLLVGTADNTVAVLTAGTNDHVLTAASGEATGLKWAAAAAGSTDGWTAAGETWTYASASTFTVAGVDVTAKYSKGTRIKLTQSATVKYFVVTASSFATDTTVTITGGTDYTFTNNAVTLNYYSYQANPQGYPGWFNFDCSPTGWAATPTQTKSQFSVVGKQCMLILSVTGTSNATTMGFTAPIAGQTSYIGLPGHGVNNGSDLQDFPEIGASPTTAITVYTSAVGGSWTNTGTKTHRGYFIYDI